MSHKHQLAAWAVLSLATGSALAVETTISGFAQLTVGRVLSGNPTAGQDSDTPYTINAKPGYSYRCPCFVANYEKVGVYDYHRTDVTPETLAGIQGNFKFNSALSATVQLVGRTANRSIDVDWAYGSYKFNSETTLQVGRKRLPLYNYADYMYVGYAYPWVRPPQDLYGWQIYDYDGVNLLHNATLGNWTVAANVWAGGRHTKDNDLLGKLYYGSQIDERWKNMLGAYVEASNDVVSARVVTMRTTVDRFAVNKGVRVPVMGGQNGVVNGVAQRFYGLSFNVDYANWLLRSELNYIDRPSVANTFTAQSYSGGYRFGKQTTMFTWAKFQERAAHWPDGIEQHATVSLSHRIDLPHGQAVKLQYDRILDGSKWLFSGDAKLLSASWQVAF